MKAGRTTLAAVLLCGFVVAIGAGAAEEIQKVRAFYFGNSFTGNTMVGLHPLLGESAGKEWVARANISPGIPIWAHMHQQMQRGGHYDRFQAVGAETDAIVMLLFGGEGLSSIVTEKWMGKIKFDEPTDIGDIAACSYLIREYLDLNPGGRAYTYTAWPGIPGVREFRDRLREERQQELMEQGMDRREAREEARKVDLTHEQLEPLRKGYDYAALWLNEDYDPDWSQEDHDRFTAYRNFLRDAQRPGAEEATPQALAEAAGVEVAQVKEDLKAAGYRGDPIDPEALMTALEDYRRKATMTHCRRHMYLVMEGLKEEWPELWQEGRLGMVPVGDVFLALDRKMRDGKVPGIVNIGEYSADGGHLRSGLPRYTLAATHYAVLFKDHPKNVDWRVFQDRGNYESGKFGFYVHQPDLAVHLDITPERVGVVNDTIWEVVTGHPYTRVEED